MHRHIRFSQVLWGCRCQCREGLGARLPTLPILRALRWSLCPTGLLFCETVAACTLELGPTYQVLQPTQMVSPDL